MEGGDAVRVGARAAGDAALGVVEADGLRVGGRERGKRGQECDGDDSHGRSHRFPQSERESGENGFRQNHWRILSANVQT